jgi:hypothetical protein
MSEQTTGIMTAEEWRSAARACRAARAEPLVLPSGAALAFKSAATYGAVGGAAALAGRALAGPEVREGERGAVARRPGEVAPELIVTGTSAQGQETAATQKTVQVIFQGPVYGGQAGIDELVRHISEAVTDRDVNLVAYTVVRQPATRA